METRSPPSSTTPGEVKKIKLESEHEFRFEVDYDQTVTIRV